MRKAWTSHWLHRGASGCASSFAGTASTGADTTDTKYATGWDYSTAGSITTVSDLLASTTRTYTPDAVHPAAVASITNPDIPGIPAVPAVPPSEEFPDGVAEVPAVDAVSVAADTFTYDALGRMLTRVTHEVDPATRTSAAHTLSLSWDASSNLVKTDLDGAQVVYLYDSSGQRALQIGVTAGTATAYLGATEVTDPDTAVSASGDLAGTRYYSLGGATVAVRQASATTTDSTLSFMFGDAQGSAQVMVTHTVDPVTGTLDAITAGSVTRNAYTPYGATRGEVQLTIDHGWLNKIADTDTGLTYLGARYYDPLVSRFISPDPLMNPMDPRTLDSYMYANDNPTSYSDASGLYAQGDEGMCGQYGCVGGMGSVKTVQAGYYLSGSHSSGGTGGAGGPGGTVAKAAKQSGWGFVGSIISGAWKTAAKGLPPVMAWNGGKLLVTDSTAFFGQYTSAWNTVKNYGSDWWMNAQSGAAVVTGNKSLGDHLYTMAHSSQMAHIGNSWDAGDGEAVGSTYIQFVGIVASIAGLGGGIKPGGSVAADSAAARTAPDALSLDRPISQSATQNQVAWNRVAELQAQGAKDIRLNQTQVNVDGFKVGNNRPDLQFTLGNTRYYEEFESPGSPRGPGHLNTIFGNDPAGVVSVFLGVP